MRLTSDAKQAFRWMVGGYFLRTSNFTSSTTGFDLGLGIDRIEYDPSFNSATNPTLSWFTDTDVDKVYAGFGNVSYDVTSALEASLALRYDKDDASQTVDPRNTGGVPPGCTMLRVAIACGRPRSTGSTEGVAEVSTHPGCAGLCLLGRGLPQRLVQPVWHFGRRGRQRAGGVSDALPAELTDSYEVGFKSEWFDHTLRFNGAGFYTTVRGQQYFVFLGGIGAQILVSIDKVKIEGGELEAVYSPLKGLDLYASVGLSESKSSNTTESPDVGNWAPYVPQSSENAGRQYRFPISTGLQILTRADFIVKGRAVLGSREQRSAQRRRAAQPAPGAGRHRRKVDRDRVRSPTRPTSPTTRSSCWVDSRSRRPARVTWSKHGITSKPWPCEFVRRPMSAEHTPISCTTRSIATPGGAARCAPPRSIRRRPTSRRGSWRRSARARSLPAIWSFSPTAPRSSSTPSPSARAPGSG